MSSKKNNYRATFILDLRETEEAPETVIESMKSEIAAIDGEVSEVNDMGQKDFARVTDVKRPTGHYVQIEFAGPANANTALQERLHLNKVAYRIFVEAI
jgi:small subunit ribosomal protein S6